MNKEKLFWNGIFLVDSDCEMTGTLSLNGEDSVLHLWTNHPIEVDSLNRETITGILDNQKKVSLFNCIVTRGPRFYGKERCTQHYRVFPHYAVVGHHHVLYSEKAISKISFVIDDAISLFHDRTSFGTVNIPPEQMGDLTSIEIFAGNPFEGTYPILAYWTGKEEIFKANTSMGKIYARHQPGFNMGGPDGASITNKIWITVEFSSPRNIGELNVEIRNILRFFQLVLGRPQNLLRLEIKEKELEHHESSVAYLNMYPNYPRGSGYREPDFRDILIDAGENPEELANLLCAWLEKDKTWRTVRAVFSTGWARGRDYGPDRIVGAANMFDLLPKDALPLSTELDEEIEAAIEVGRSAFDKLEKSLKKDRLFFALGNLKQPSLKEKIKHRCALISEVIGEDIPDVCKVTDAAVNLRNLYVHGTKMSDKRKKKLEESIDFLTDTLEFVFCVSDLVESGWDLGSWHKKRKGEGHPFASYLNSYKGRLEQFLK
ncbi:MAG: hypothetical protein OXI37_04905 [Gammaproteobacteria bacterium]|nr:hypothetical protein [Gammaproteobacteria bacterium]